jgi:hypothetical protein
MIQRLRLFTAAVALALLAGPAAADNTTTVRWGPIVLPPAGPDGPGQVHNEVAGVSGLAGALVGLFRSVADYDVPKPCENCFITGIYPNLVLEDGTTANFDNGTMLHHVVNLNYGNNDITCRPGFSNLINLLGLVVGGNERLFAAGNERTGGSLPPGYGVYLDDRDDLGLIYHLMNMSPYEKTVYFEYTFTWVPASANLERVRPIWLDVDQCEDSEIDVPAGYSDVHWDWKADRSADLVTAAGHIHDYGISISYRNESRNRDLCISVAGYAAGSPFAPVGPGSGADAAHPVSANVVSSDPLGLANYDGHISDMTICDSGGRIRKRDTTRLHTQIHRPDATDHDMGIMIGFLDQDFCITDYWCF